MTNEIIELLKDDRQYYHGVGRSYLSNSDIGILLTNPKQFGKSREDNKNFAEGRYFHQLMIEPDKALLTPSVDVSSRNTKEYKNFCETNNYAFCMLTKEKEEIERLVQIMKSNIFFFSEIYRDGNTYETPGVGNIQGLMWKGKADIITDDCIIDLKTTSDINKFKYSAKAYNYDSQCYIYQRLFGKALVFYVIDKETGQLGIFRPTESFIRGGEEKVTRAIRVYENYFGENATDDIENHCIRDVLE
jgi:hypothetical protein